MSRRTLAFLLFLTALVAFLAVAGRLVDFNYAAAPPIFWLRTIRGALFICFLAFLIAHRRKRAPRTRGRS